jgi:hypothetical protein
VMQMSASLTASRTLGAGAAEHVAVEFARANSSARAASTSKHPRRFQGKNRLDGLRIDTWLGLRSR